ncbi:MAG TPA: hypothetical protein VK879_23200 [Candidatus Sulfomarinibacteraceae bacterium]|nr:hypothetical protein [Candidatus Sulfomarinibacteraceae bacterium]
MSFMPITVKADSNSNEFNHSSRRLAARQFEASYDRGAPRWLRRLRATREQCLLALDSVRREAPLRGQRDGGIQSVPIAQIQGSENRHCDYTPDFRPRQAHSRNRWISIAAARLVGAELPPVALIQIGERYFVRDGHHRISVARAQGQQDIDAEVIVWDVGGSTTHHGVDK